jgi:hypothetical protein
VTVFSAQRRHFWVMFWSVVDEGYTLFMAAAFYLSDTGITSDALFKVKANRIFHLYFMYSGAE